MNHVIRWCPTSPNYVAAALERKKKHPIRNVWRNAPCTRYSSSAMDPVSLSLGIAGLLPMVATAITSAKSYWDGAKNAQQAISALIAELEALRGNLNALNIFLNGDSLKMKSLVFDQSSVLVSCSSACKTQLDTLCKRLDLAANARLGRLFWPLHRKEHQEVVQTLRGFTLWMQFAMSINGCMLLASNSDDVLAIMSKQMELFKTLQIVENRTADLQAALDDQNKRMEESLVQGKRVEILKWISTFNHEQKHLNVRSYRVENTGGWLLVQSEFTSWREDMASPNILWCYGAPGTGKTVLT